MAEQELEIEEVIAPSKRRSFVVPVLAAAVAVLAGLCGYLALQRPSHAEVEKKPAVVLSKQELYLSLEPNMVVNFKQDDAIRFLQVGVSIMSHDQQALDAAKEADPVIRNALLMLFSNQDYQTLSDANGRLKLQAQALATVKKIVDQRLGRPSIEALYFTSFVMQ